MYFVVNNNAIKLDVLTSNLVYMYVHHKIIRIKQYYLQKVNVKFRVSVNCVVKVNNYVWTMFL